MKTAKTFNENPKIAGDKFLRWPLSFSIVLFVIVTLGAYAGSMVPLLQIFIAALLVLALLVCLLTSVRYLIQKKPRMAASVIFVPLFVSLWCIYPIFFIAESTYCVDYLRFFITKNSFTKIVDSLPINNGPRYAEFDWGGFFDHPIKLVFDESDQLSLLPEKRSTLWWEKAGRNSEFGVCQYSARELYAHFYVVKFSC